MRSTSLTAAFAPDAPLSLLRSRLRQGLKATPLCLAIIGWLCDFPTKPSVAEIRRNPDDKVWLRLSNEATLAAFSTVEEFLDQIKIICQSVGMTKGQKQATLTWAKEKLK
jgi:hypothetical protein